MVKINAISPQSTTIAMQVIPSSIPCQKMRYANPMSYSFHGTKSLENPTTSCRQQTHVAKLFIARLTRHSSQRLRQRQGHARIVLGLDWHTTHCGPPEPRPSAPVCHAPDEVFETDEVVERARREIRRCSNSSISSEEVILPLGNPGGRLRVEVRTRAFSKACACR